MMAAAGLAGIYFAVSGSSKIRCGCQPCWSLFWFSLLNQIVAELSLPFRWRHCSYRPISTASANSPMAAKIPHLMHLTFLLTSSLHLLAVWIWTPEDMTFWLRDIYFSLFAGEGVQGTKLHGDSPDLPANWAHPFWYYFAITYRNHFFLLPLIAMGAPFLPRRVYSVFSWIVPGIASIFILSAFAIKSSLYVLSATLFIYALAGLCISALLFKTDQMAVPWNRWTIGVALFILLLLAGRTSGPCKNRADLQAAPCTRYGAPLRHPLSRLLRLS